MMGALEEAGTIYHSRVSESTHTFFDAVCVAQLCLFSFCFLFCFVFCFFMFLILFLFVCLFVFFFFLFVVCLMHNASRVSGLFIHDCPFCFCNVCKRTFPTREEECKDGKKWKKWGRIILVFHATFKNISVILWWSVLLVEEDGVPNENQLPPASHWQTLSHQAISSKPEGMMLYM